MGFLEEKHRIKTTIGTPERIELIFVSCSRVTIIEAVVTAGQPEASCAKLAGAWKRRRSTRTYSSSVRSFTLTVHPAFYRRLCGGERAVHSPRQGQCILIQSIRGPNLARPRIRLHPIIHPLSLSLSLPIWEQTVQRLQIERESGASEEGGGNLLRSSTNVTVGRIGNHAPVRCSHIV